MHKSAPLNNFTPQHDNGLEFRLNRIREIEKFSIARRKNKQRT